MSFRIDKKKQLVELFLGAQSSIKGVVFLDTNYAKYEGAERVLELLREPEPFFPFESETGRMMLVRKESVKKVVVDSNYELEMMQSYGIDSLIPQEVVICLIDGTEEAGTLLIEPREGFSRVSDQINRSQGFILLTQENVVHLIGVSHIAAIRENN